MKNNKTITILTLIGLLGAINTYAMRTQSSAGTASPIERRESPLASPKMDSPRTIFVSVQDAKILLGEIRSKVTLELQHTREHLKIKKQLLISQAALIRALLNKAQEPEKIDPAMKAHRQAFAMYEDSISRQVKKAVQTNARLASVRKLLKTVLDEVATNVCQDYDDMCTTEVLGADSTFLQEAIEFTNEKIAELK